jgi:phenylpropionate dioxygenase-like ring-hydroxylating dioxygenase large terminal subunit
MSAPTQSGAAAAERRHRIWERAGRLREHWYVACTAVELRPGRIFAATILGLGIAVYRKLDNGIAAILDQCVHRGTALSAGRLTGDCLVCPYHGWRYDGTGRVVHIPSEDGVSLPARPHAYSQRSFTAREAYGLIWVYVGDGDPATVPIFAMPFWESSPWLTYYMTSVFDGTVGALAQNFMDVPHTVHVHDTIFRKPRARLMQSTVELKPASVEVEYHAADDTIGVLPWLTNPHREALVHTDKFFTPNITRCDYHWGTTSGFVITSQMTPIDDRSCRVYTLISYRFPVAHVLARLLRPLIRTYTRTVLGQDIRIMRVNRRGLDNAPAPQIRHVKADLVHVGIERLIAATRAGEALAEQHLGKRPVSFHL